MMPRFHYHDAAHHEAIHILRKRSGNNPDYSAQHNARAAFLRAST